MTSPLQTSTIRGTTSVAIRRGLDCANAGYARHSLPAEVCPVKSDRWNALDSQGPRPTCQESFHE